MLYISHKRPDHCLTAGTYTSTQCHLIFIVSVHMFTHSSDVFMFGTTISCDKFSTTTITDGYIQIDRTDSCCIIRVRIVVAAYYSTHSKL